MKIYHYETIPSTNAEAKTMVLNGKREGVLLAKKQTAGRGRLGRSFFSENGIFMSIDIDSCPKTVLAPLGSQAIFIDFPASFAGAVTFEFFDIKLAAVSNLLESFLNLFGIDMTNHD
jgi:hypothetical protein